MFIPKSIEEAAKYVNESTTKEQRQARKALMFPYLYGAGSKKLSEVITLPKKS